MRPTRIDRLKDLVEKQKSFKLIPYGNSPVLSFKAVRSFWIVSSLEFLSYPEEIKVKENSEVRILECYFEGGYVLGYEFNLDNFYEVLGWEPGKEAEE